MEQAPGRGAELQSCSSKARRRNSTASIGHGALQWSPAKKLRLPDLEQVASDVRLAQAVEVPHALLLHLLLHTPRAPRHKHIGACRG